MQSEKYRGKKLKNLSMNEGPIRQYQKIFVLSEFQNEGVESGVKICLKN